MGMNNTRKLELMWNLQKELAEKKAKKHGAKDVEEPSAVYRLETRSLEILHHDSKIGLVTEEPEIPLSMLSEEEILQKVRMKRKMAASTPLTD